ncbi:aryl-sulfate sulfotransferase [Bacteroidota bacterium]
MFCNLFAQNNNSYQFINPKPASIMVSNETNIILRHSSIIDRATLSTNLVRVEGSKSGVHAGELILSDDERTIVFNPYKAFAGNENVNVVLKKGIKTETGSYIPEFSFSFTTALAGIVQLHNPAFSESTSLLENQHPVALKGNGINSSLPAPTITIDSVNNPSPGYIFMATWDRNVPAKYGNFIFILDSRGVIVDSVRVNGAPFDFQVQPNGLLSYALGDFSINVPLPGEELRHIVRDSTLAVVDSFKMKNGYITDFHEFKMLPNGHVIMMSYHTIIYDMSTIVEGGKTDASLVINIIQEQDRDKNVVFEWRNIDYIPITDSDLDLTAPRINYGTLNAFDIDDDGNILASFRNHSEIMKISRETGELMWRMGGPRGEFTFVGEHEENAPYYHSRQHNIRRRPNGNITMFDNGQVHQPPYSRAVEYSLDEGNKVATLVSEWRYPNGNIFCATAGNAELLANGGWFIGYGVPNPQFVKRNAVEVHPDGSIALEFSLPNGILAYRAYKFPWKESVSKPSYTNFEVKEGNTYSFNNESIITGVKIKYISLSADDYNESKITRLPYGPGQPEFIDNIISVSPVSIIYEGFAIYLQTAEFHIDLAQYPEIKNPENTTVHYREFPNQGLFLPKSTTYDNIENELVVTLNGFGEVVFGVPIDDIDNNTPILYEPLNQQKLILQDTLTVRWTGKGMYNSFNVQITTDSTFATILHESNTNLSYYSISGLTNNTKYFWRVNSELDTQTSQWSEVWNFSITDPYINTVSPNGGETWASGNSEIIRWETNILENVRIDLLQDQNNILSLDTIPGSHQAYRWNLPPDLQAGENYRIQITSESDSNIFGISEDVFSIIDTVTSIVEYKDKVPDEYNLVQNFPNPFNPTTNIKFSIPNTSYVKLIIFDLLGNEIETLIDGIKAAGSYNVTVDASNFASGVYFYRIISDNFIETKKMLMLK